MTRKEIKEYNKKYYQEHKNEIKTRSKHYRSRHKRYLKIWKRKYYQKNKQKLSLQKKKYRQIHKVEIQKYFTRYGQQHRKQLNKYGRKYLKNIEKRLIHNFRNRIWAVLKNNVKSVHTVKLLGCSIEFLKQYLESKFTKGMTWKNYGKWHIDHIIACAKFDISKIKEQYKCFNYTNLQPLWARDNLSKNKY